MERKTVQKVKRKAVYIPFYLWSLLDEEAYKLDEPITTIVKRRLVSTYPLEKVNERRNNKFSEKLGLELPDKKPKVEEGDEEDDF